MTRNNWRNRLIAIGTPVSFAIAGGALAGDSLKTWYPALRKSPLVLPIWAFLPVAVLYYLMCGVILYRLLTRVARNREQRIAFGLLLTMMATNEGWNYVLLGSPYYDVVGESILKSFIRFPSPLLATPRRGAEPLKNC